MLSKILGFAIAGVFIGAAAAELSGYWTRLRKGKNHDRKVPPAITESEIQAAEKKDENEPKTQS